MEVIGPTGDNEGWRKGALGGDNIVTLKRKAQEQGNPSFRVSQQDRVFHRKKKKYYVRWRRGSSEALPLDANADTSLSDVGLDLIARNTIAKDVMLAFKQRSGAEKVQSYLLWAILVIQVIGVFYAGTKLNEVLEYLQVVHPIAPVASP